MKRLGLYLPIVALLVLAVGWSIFWFVARANTERAIDGWIAAEAAQGRVWTCPQRALTGYPFRLELRCADPALAGDFGTGPVTVKARQLTAFAQIYQPNRIIVEAAGPLELVGASAAGGALPSLAWETFRISLRGSPGRMERFSAVMDKPVLTATAPMSAGRAELHVRRAPLKPGEQPEADARAYDVAIRLAEAHDPALDQFFRNAAPAGVDLTATVTQGDDFLADASPIDRLEAWRKASGAIELSSLRFAKGPVSLDAAGSFGLDDQRRLAGQADLTAVGFGPVLQAYGISERALNVGGALGALFGGAPAAQNGAPSPPGALRAPLRFADGRVYFGPIRTPLSLTPLY